MAELARSKDDRIIKRRQATALNDGKLCTGVQGTAVAFAHDGRFQVAEGKHGKALIRNAVSFADQLNDVCQFLAKLRCDRFARVDQHGDIKARVCGARENAEVTNNHVPVDDGKVGG